MLPKYPNSFGFYKPTVSHYFQDNSKASIDWKFFGLFILQIKHYPETKVERSAEMLRYQYSTLFVMCCFV